MKADDVCPCCGTPNGCRWEALRKESGWLDGAVTNSPVVLTEEQIQAIVDAETAYEEDP